MQKSERVVQKANATLNSASTALELSYKSINDIDAPQNGTMSSFLASRTLLSSARDIIKHNQDWVNFAKEQVQSAKERLKLDMIEYEKFNHLEFQEIQKEIKKLKAQEIKDLDEVALMTHTIKAKQ
ncbi:MAG: FliJ family protein [Epsilonproteobacteria bacterium]|nr:FliJ family protein [Campylobacterota bacterium]